MFEASGSGGFNQTTPLTTGTQHSVLCDCHLDAKRQGLPHHLLDIGSREIPQTARIRGQNFVVNFSGKKRLSVIFTLVLFCGETFHLLAEFHRRKCGS